LKEKNIRKSMTWKVLFVVAKNMQFKEGLEVYRLLAYFVATAAKTPNPIKYGFFVHAAAVLFEGEY
jgi:hypothetical protein